MPFRNLPKLGPAARLREAAQASAARWLSSNPWFDDPRRRQYLAVLGVVCLHLLFFVCLQKLLQPEPGVPHRPTALQVRLIESTAPAPPAAVQPPPRAARETPPVPQVRADAARQRADRHRHESARPSLEDGPSSVPAEPIGLFDASGRVVLPDIAPSAPADPFEANRQMPEFAASPLDHPAALAYRSTRFNRRWVPDGETLGGTFVRKATFEKHWDTRGGNRIQCVIVVIFPACLWGWIPRVPIEELKAMRADPPDPRQ